MDKDYDYLKLKNQSKITNEFDTGEYVIFSYDLKKVNDYGKSQTRTLLITNMRVYNLSGK